MEIMMVTALRLERQCILAVVNFGLVGVIVVYLK